MKTLRLLTLCLILSSAAQAQKSLTGLWTGTLTNDSSHALRKEQPFELALTEYRGKVYGYSRSSFVFHDTLFYIIKRVKGKIENGVCEVTDDDILTTNFPVRPDKGVRTTYTFLQKEEDSTWHLDGRWKTNKTKLFFALTGGIDLHAEKNLDNSKLFPHLEELGKADDVAFYKEAKTPAPVIARNDPPKSSATENKKSEKPVEKKEPVVTAKTNKEEKKTTTTASKPPETVKPAEVAKTLPVAPPVVAGPAAMLKERSNGLPQVVTFKSDSLVLALYDNGEIDGDTVSLLFNGEVIIAKQMLKASALKKTIYLPAGVDESTLLLYAENLGKYPPNTGLLVIHDGEETYQLRFSADLQQNASIIFRRKKD